MSYNFLKNIEKVWDYSFIHTPIFDLNHVNGEPSTIQQWLTIGIRSHVLKSDNLLINQVKNIMLEVYAIICSMYGTFWMVSKWRSAL